MVNFSIGSPNISEEGEYDVWTIPSGTTVHADIESGETIENLLIDLRAANASFMFRSRNESGWTIRNVGFLGMGDRDTSGGASVRFLFQMSVPSGGSGLIENVYAYAKADAPGSMQHHGSRLGCFYARGAHAGHMTIRNTYVEGFGNNAAYMSDPGKENGNRGTVLMENCFHRDNTVSQYRIGTDGSEIRNCIGIVNDPEGLRGRYPGFDDRNGRGVWARGGGNNVVRNSTMYISPNDVNWGGAFEATQQGVDDPQWDFINLAVHGSHVNPDVPRLSSGQVDPVDVDENPTIDVLSGVPTSPEMAARGETAMPDAPELGSGNGGNGGGGPNFRPLSIEGVGGRTDYTFYTSGEIRELSGIGEADTISQVESGWQAVGFVRGGTDTYEFDGDVLCLEIDGPEPNIQVAGNPVNVGAFDGCPPPSNGNGGGDEPATAGDLGTVVLAAGLGGTVGWAAIRASDDSE